MNLDVRGEVCPYPMMKAVEAMKKVKAEVAKKVVTLKGWASKEIHQEAIIEFLKTSVIP